MGPRHPSGPESLRPPTLGIDHLAGHAVLRGTSLWEGCYPVRERTGNRAEALAAAVTACMATASIHQAKWIHGDLLPHHISLMPGGVRLIDWSWGWSPDSDLPVSNAYNGCFIHLGQLRTDRPRPVRQRPVLATQPGEVWTPAASI